MEQYRRPIVELLAVPDGLGHSLRDIQPLHALDLRVYAGDPDYIRRFSERNGFPRLCWYTVGLEYAANLQFTTPTLFLL